MPRHVDVGVIYYDSYQDYLENHEWDELQDLTEKEDKEWLQQKTDKYMK